MRDYRVEIDSVNTYADAYYRWRVSLDGRRIGEGTSGYRHVAVRDARRCVKAYAKGKPNTYAREFFIRA